MGEFISTIISCPHWPNFHLEVERLASRLAQLSPFDLAEAIRDFYGLYSEKTASPAGATRPRANASMLLIRAGLPRPASST